MYSAVPPRATDDSIASSATSVLPLAVGTLATTLSPPVTPASTASACGGYSSSIPFPWR